MDDTMTQDQTDAETFDKWLRITSPAMIHWIYTNMMMLPDCANNLKADEIKSKLRKYYKLDM